MSNQFHFISKYVYYQRLAQTWIYTHATTALLLFNKQEKLLHFSIKRNIYETKTLQYSEDAISEIRNITEK